jgi:tRNA (guanine-N7-)-methyltransferase
VGDRPDPDETAGRLTPVVERTSAEVDEPGAQQPVAPANRRILSFSPRGGRMNDVQRRAWSAHADHWYLDWYRDIATTPDGVRPFDQAAAFGRQAPLVLEIGSGMGDATAAMAAARPEIDVLAVEVYRPGIAQTFAHLAAAGAGNVRVLRADVVDVLEAAIPANRLDEVWTFFPDPWPKRKHHKRRLVAPPFVGLVASRLRPGGIWWLATDWEPYARQMMAALSGCPLLINPHAGRSGGWAPRPGFRPPTRFERRGETEGRPIFDLQFVRG